MRPEGTEGLLSYCGFKPKWYFAAMIMWRYLRIPGIMARMGKFVNFFQKICFFWMGQAGPK
jgi:hypothetical protein